MSVVPGPALDDELGRLLHTWMPAQRWYPAKGRGVGLRDLGAFAWPSSEPGVDVVTHVVGLDSGDRLDVVQVPLTYRAAPLASAVPGATVGVLGSGDAARHVTDGPHDPAFVGALLAALRTGEGALPVPAGAPSRVLSGEQSNTSIIVEPVDGPPAIVKLFRTLHPGANPDVEVLEALTRVGSGHVPALRGWLEGTWLPAVAGPGVIPVSGHLAVAVEFLPGSEDAWRVALSAVRDRTDFTAAARDLGAATAQVHADLATAFGTTAVDEAARARMVASLRARLDWARSAVRDLDVHAAALDAHAAALDGLSDLPPLQRVHGDLHLGQVLQAPGKGWVLLDFEGEPLRPLAERTVPDLALRDVAGMLRSVDYAAGHDTVGEGVDPAAVASADAWAAATRDAFCDGYGSVAGRDPREQADLLRALQLDKALYEVVYEARNRPSWLRIPLTAVARLLG
ncbi:maltokinase N-terminal cap-like domain-containing protein [Aquipuribacter hungaricus]|uniref:Maltokinase n=1 Tax=Aquipuribacter hungaricus TaxID=545624 RepID=A0ABV7WFR6_9MICO